MAILNRTKACSVDQIEENLLEAKGIFIDRMHEINLTLQVKVDDLEILWARAEMLRGPQITCYKAQGESRNLVGIKIGAGSRKAVQNAVGHAHGCIHLADLALDLIKAVIQAKYKLENQVWSREESLANRVAALGGSCNFWTETKQRFENTNKSKQRDE